MPPANWLWIAWYLTGDVHRANDLVEDVADQALVAALRRLPPQQRMAVVLRHYCDLSEKQVAQELGTSVGAVKSNTSRGLATLRQHLTEQENPHEH